LFTPVGKELLVEILSAANKLQIEFITLKNPELLQGKLISKGGDTDKDLSLGVGILFTVDKERLRGGVKLSIDNVEHWLIPSNSILGTFTIGV
jgi:hypothetical protein